MTKIERNEMNIRHVPEEIKIAVGEEKSSKASETASAAAERLDRDNFWNQESANVYRAQTWTEKK